MFFKKYLLNITINSFFMHIPTNSSMEHPQNWKKEISAVKSDVFWAFFENALMGDH